MTLNQNKNGMDMIAYPPTLVADLSLSWHRGEGPGGRGEGVQQSRPNRKQCFVAQGSSDWTHGGIYVLTPLQIITPNLTIWHCSLGYTSSVLQGKSLTALILAGNSPQFFGLYYTGDPKIIAMQISQPSCCQLSGEVIWWSTGRLVGG